MPPTLLSPDGAVVNTHSTSVSGTASGPMSGNDRFNRRSRLHCHFIGAQVSNQCALSLKHFQRCRTGIFLLLQQLNDALQWDNSLTRKHAIRLSLSFTGWIIRNILEMKMGEFAILQQLQVFEFAD